MYMSKSSASNEYPPMMTKPQPDSKSLLLYTEYHRKETDDFSTVLSHSEVIKLGITTAGIHIFGEKFS